MQFRVRSTSASAYHARLTPRSGPDSFQPDPASSRLSAEPLVKAATQLMALINSLCAMLRTAPFHRENHARLILQVIVQFYTRCYDRFQLLVIGTKNRKDMPPDPVLAAQWAQTPVFAPSLMELLNCNVCFYNLLHFC
jgi:exocyst complex component 4